MAAAPESIAVKVEQAAAKAPKVPFLKRVGRGLVDIVVDPFLKDPIVWDKPTEVLNPNARSLHNAGYIRPEEVRTVMVDGKEVHHVISAVPVGKAYENYLKNAKPVVETVEKKAGSKIGWIAAGAAALVAIVAVVTNRRSQDTIPDGALANMPVPVPAKPVTFASEVAGADDYAESHWQNTVKAGRGQAPQVAGSINPKMSVVPSDMVQDLGPAPGLRK